MQITDIVQRVLDDANARLETDNPMTSNNMNCHVVSNVSHVDLHYVTLVLDDDDEVVIRVQALVDDEANILVLVWNTPDMDIFIVEPSEHRTPR
jgi:hypothetical protein